MGTYHLASRSGIEIPLQASESIVIPVISHDSVSITLLEELSIAEGVTILIRSFEQKEIKDGQPFEATLPGTIWFSMWNRALGRYHTIPDALLKCHLAVGNVRKLRRMVEVQKVLHGNADVAGGLHT